MNLAHFTLLLAIPAEMGEAFTINQCVKSGGSNQICQYRGKLDIDAKRMLHSSIAIHNIGFTNRDSFNPDLFLAEPIREYTTYEFEFDKESLAYSLHFARFVKSSQNVEEFTVRLGPDNLPISLSVALKPALGSPLMKTVLVNRAVPSVAQGPFISEKDSKPAKDSGETETPTEEPSFLRKYWWLIVGAMLFSSVMGPSDSNRGQQPSSASSNAK
jgi:hypothetical protein